MSQAFPTDYCPLNHSKQILATLMRYDPSTSLSFFSAFLLIPYVYLFSWLDQKTKHPALVFLVRAIGVIGFWSIIGLNFGWFN